MEPTIIDFVSKNPIMVGILVALVVLLVVTEIQIHTRKFNEARPTEVVALINRDNAVLIDIRSEKEFASGHVINAINIPIEGLGSELNKLGKYKDKPLVVCCRTGQTSLRACKELKNSGFSIVHNLRGGVTAWERDGLPLVKA